MNGFDPARLQRAWDLVADTVARGDIPGAVVLAGRRGHPDQGPLAWGSAALRPEVRPMTPDTIFDLASLTKVVATTMACWVAIERGWVRLQDPVGRFLPAAAVADRTVLDLLTHTSGLPPGRDLRRAGGDPEARLRAALGTAPDHPAGERVAYSDLGFIILGALLAAASGRSLPDLAAETVFGPLGMTETRFLPPESWRTRIAPTEWSDELGGPAWGVVHDENARALGGVAGHAGLFSTASDLGRLCRALLGGGPPVLSPAAVAAMTRNVTAHLGVDRTPGWQAAGTGGGAAGDLLGPDAYGHTGFTGTSLWIAPHLDFYCVLLTNRVHLGRERTAPPVNRLRAVLHTALAAALEPEGTGPARRRPRLTARLVLRRPGADGPEVLLVLHRHPDRSFWCFPGGGLEPGETVAAAAVREAEEETGLRVALEGVCHVQDRPDVDTVDVFYTARILGGTAALGTDPDRPGAAPPVLTELRWVPLAEFPRHRVLPADLAAALAAGS